MSKKIDVAGYPAPSNAELSEILEIKMLQELSISDWPPLPKVSNPYRMVTQEAGAPYCDPMIHTKPLEVSDEQPDYTTISNISLEEQVVENCISPKSGEIIADESPFPSILYSPNPKVGGKEEFGFQTFYELKPEKDDADYDSDNTCDDFVQCGEDGLCKCHKMQGGQYYDYYLQMKETDDYTLYSQGRCVLPSGTILHFTVAPDKLKREDVKKALEELGAKIEFIDFQRGSKEGWVRLSYAYEARVIIKKMTDKKLNIAETDVVFRVLSGKEEKRYLKKVIDAIYELQQNAKGLNKKLKKHGYKYVTEYKDSGY